MKPFFRGIVLVLTLVLSFNAVKLANAQDVYGGFGVGYPVSLSVGIEDALAPAADVRFDVSLYGLFLFVYIEGFVEASASAIQTFSNGLYVGGGPHVAFGRSAFPFSEEAEGESDVTSIQGTYLGAQGLVGYEPGEGSVRFFVEGGLTAGFKVSGNEGSNTRIRPRLTLGLNFPF